MIQFILAGLLWIAQPSTYTGTWINIDDETGVEKSEITLYIKEGKLYGKIDRLLLQEDQGKLCTQCRGKEKNQPIEGLVILRGLSRSGDLWTDGEIMDPANGKAYDCTLSLDDANTLKVRGYLGFSFLGRTQIWKRKR